MKNIKEQQILIKCSKCDYLDDYSKFKTPHSCHKCGNEIIILDKENIFSFISSIIKPYIFENQILLHNSNNQTIKILEDRKVISEQSYMEIINDYIYFLKDLAVDNIRDDNCLDGSNFIAVRNISIDLYYLTQLLNFIK